MIVSIGEMVPVCCTELGYEAGSRESLLAPIALRAAMENWPIGEITSRRDYRQQKAALKAATKAKVSEAVKANPQSYGFVGIFAAFSIMWFVEVIVGAIVSWIIERALEKRFPVDAIAATVQNASASCS